MYAQKVNVELCHCDMNARMKVNEVMLRFGDLALYDAFETHIYTKDMMTRYGYIVAKQTLVMDEPVYYGDEVMFSTVVRKSSHVIFPREYKIEKDGRVIGRGYSTWTLIDMNTRSIVRPERIGITMPEGEKMAVMPKTLFSRDDLTKVMSHKVVYSDLDFNHHMNNTRYAALACDALGVDVMKDHFVKEITFNYKKETRRRRPP